MRPQSDNLDLERTVKKSATNWIVTTGLIVIGLGTLALGRAQVQSMLEGYQTKEQARQLEVEHNSKEDRLRNEVQTLQDTLNIMDKKLDHLQYAIEYSQDQQGRLRTPKQKDQP